MKIKYTILLVLVLINNAFSQENGKIENGTYVCNKFEWKIKKDPIPKRFWNGVQMGICILGLIQNQRHIKIRIQSL